MPSLPELPVCRLFQTPTFTPTLFTLPSPECSAMPRSPYGHIVSAGSVSCRMPRKKYRVGKSSPPVKVSAPGFGSFCAKAVPAAPAHVVTVNSPTIAARIRKPDLVVTRTSTPPRGFATCGIADVARPGARETPDRKSTRLNSSHANISYAVFCLKKKKKKKKFFYIKNKKKP